ncbi:hypothetical protein DPSP01_007926 [Paraphaeosphaeria sporulosa]|uniref:Uncharacterized protein n=1 Tax=Paraphaeosphaeria sporulosa TaxID=1460663 RepID=A0A177CIB8_9PLEO|nr:uncharacterized protein CC84DRAFT_1163467 [Paraphaeosphaeria sporulosa]OAG07253.1 hypothetical protein CC84DRAFT_1163467 [Paraphaeosphaeria sporulosa]
MSGTLFTSTTSGALFGAALASSGVYAPSVIISQMHLSTFHMLKVFITASASSAVIISVFDRLAISKSCPRSPSPLGFFGRYDGNIVGGLMVGVGMALTGACPGTVLVQLASGVRSGWYVLAGGVLGGIVYAWPVSAFVKTRTEAARRKDKAQGQEEANQKLTVQSRLGVSTPAGVAGYVALCLSVLGVATAVDPTRSPLGLPPLLGGLAIGAAQAATLLLTGNAVGVSTGYEVAGQYFWRLLNPSSKSKSGPAPPLRSLFFAGGIIAGALAYNYSGNGPLAGVAAGVDVTASSGVIGGLVMVLGARLAGGCTSGHGISGMSMLGISSFITVACMFAGGMGAAWVMG